MLSCILGLEIFVLNGIKQIDHDKNIPNENNKSRLGDVLTKDKISPFDSEMLLINSRVLSDIAAYLETEYKKINIEKVSKFQRKYNRWDYIRLEKWIWLDE